MFKFCCQKAGAKLQSQDLDRNQMKNDKSIKTSKNTIMPSACKFSRKKIDQFINA